MVLLGHDQESGVELLSVGDPEALIREARRRTRRRRGRRGVAVVVAVGLAVLAYLVGSGGGGVAVAESGSRPFVNVSAFAHEGGLAFVSRGVVWVLDGSRGTVRRLPVAAGYTASSPSVSHDGRWLAYLVSRGQPAMYASSFACGWLAVTGPGRIRSVACASIGWSGGARPETSLP